MVFSSITFLFYFLPIVIGIYYLLPLKFKNTFLLLSSLAFYFYGEPKYIILLISSIIIAYVFGLLINTSKHKKFFLFTSITLQLALLFYFKYIDFLIENINLIFQTKINLVKVILPIGISFYTFQIISYLIDVYRKEVDVQKNIINLATYVALFPQLIAGPIVRYKDINQSLNKRIHSIENFSSGVERFVIGLSKKILIANVLGELINEFNSCSEKSVIFYWIYAIANMLQIYFDFSGYSDMAIGLGKLFGFKFMENFNYPYISKSITEFWRRWHISLGTWFRDYLYIPLGGNRVSKIKHIRNIMIVWILTGLWHGAAWNFILWGLMFGILLCIEKYFLIKFLNKLPNIISHIYTLFIVMISFIIFSAESVVQIKEQILGLFGYRL